MSRRKAGTADDLDPTPPDPRHRPVVLHVPPRRPRSGHRPGMLSVTVGACLLLASLLTVTLVSAWAGWRVAASDPGTRSVTAEPVVPRRPAADEEAPVIPPAAGGAPAGPVAGAGEGGVRAAPRDVPAVRRAVPVETVRLNTAGASSPSRPPYEAAASAPVTTSSAPALPTPAAAGSAVAAPTPESGSTPESASVDPEPLSVSTVEGRDDGDADGRNGRHIDEQDDGDSDRVVAVDAEPDEGEGPEPDEGEGAD